MKWYTQIFLFKLFYKYLIELRFKFYVDYKRFKIKLSFFYYIHSYSYSINIY
jgi:hypothetical protein